MTIADGTRLGPYEIAARIGARGMGEVWRASDTRIGREVAIKVLPPRLGTAAYMSPELFQSGERLVLRSVSREADIWMMTLTEK